jgi:hypothetical protein
MILKMLNRLHHAAANRFGNESRIVDDVRNGRCRNTGFVGYVLDAAHFDFGF